jgi:hypothetical protein
MDNSVLHIQAIHKSRYKVICNVYIYIYIDYSFIGIIISTYKEYNNHSIRIVS